MRSWILWTVIVTLSFSSLHDLFLYSTHTTTPSSVSCPSKDTTHCETTQNCEIHNLLHFVAIVDLKSLAFDPFETLILETYYKLPTLSNYYQNLYRPPIFS